jgi:hypothetical protein
MGLLLLLVLLRLRGFAGALGRFKERFANREIRRSTRIGWGRAGWITFGDCTSSPIDIHFTLTWYIIVWFLEPLSLFSLCIPNPCVSGSNPLLARLPSFSHFGILDHEDSRLFFGLSALLFPCLMDFPNG